jgi:hypothetical protein
LTRSKAFELLTGRELRFSKDDGSLLTVPSGGLEHTTTEGRMPQEFQSSSDGEQYDASAPFL